MGEMVKRQRLLRATMYRKLRRDMIGSVFKNHATWKIKFVLL